MNAMLLRVTRALAFNRPLAYAMLDAECLGAYMGVNQYNITRLFHGYTDWLVLLAAIAIMLFGPLRDWTAGLVVTFLIAGHFGHMLVAAVSISPGLRYAQATEWMVIVALLLVMARQVELMWAVMWGGRIAWRRGPAKGRAALSAGRIEQAAHESANIATPGALG